MKKDKEDLWNEAVSNIRKDRDLAEDLLEHLKDIVNENGEMHQFVGQSLAKYLETLQRSNEQLVKLITLQQKNIPKTTEEDIIDEERKDQIFDLIKGGEE